MIFKWKKDINLTLKMHPVASLLMLYMSLWASERGLPFTVTSTVSTKDEDAKLGRVSTSHLDGRAFDISIKGWTIDEQTDFFIDHVEKYGHLGAYSHNGEQKLIVIHDGTAPHIHVQIKPGISFPRLEDL